MRKNQLIFIVVVLFLFPAVSFGFSFSGDSISGKQKQEIIDAYVKNKPLKKLLLKSENKKAVAVILALTMGPLGVHRLYLGTEVKVPVIYAATLGCVGILPLTDIVAIIISKDLEKYTNNPKVIMWIE